MAAPYKGCDITASTSNLCPVDYLCTCQTNNTSICVPTSVQTATGCIPTFANQIIEKRQDASNITQWEVQTIPTDLAAPSGQCRGTIQSTITEGEDFSYSISKTET